MPLLHSSQHLLQEQFYCRNDVSIHVFQASTGGKRIQHSTFSFNSLPELTWRLNPGPGPSLHPDQLSICPYSIPEAEHEAGHSDMGKAASPGQVEIRMLSGEGRTQVCAWVMASSLRSTAPKDKWEVRDGQGQLSRPGCSHQ